MTDAQRKEFRNRFTGNTGWYKDGVLIGSAEKCEVWIDQLLKEKDQECSIRVAAVKSNQAQLLLSQREELIEEIFPMPTPEPKPYKLSPEVALEWKDGYNTACTDIILKLRFLKPARPQERVMSSAECDCICHWGIDKGCYSGSCEHCREPGGGAGGYLGEPGGGGGGPIKNWTVEAEKETTFDTLKDATDYLKKEIEEEKKLIMLQSDLARAIGHMQGCGHPDKYLENKYPDLVGKAQEEDQ